MSGLCAESGEIRKSVQRGGLSFGELDFSDYFLKIYLLNDRDNKRAQARGAAEGEEETGSLPSSKFKAGLDPRTQVS